MRIINILALGLMAAMVVGLYFMPRFNYGLLVERQNRVEALFDELQKRALPDLSEANQHAAELPALVQEFRDSFDAAVAQMASLPAQISNLNSRVSQLESMVGALSPVGPASSGLEGPSLSLDRLEELFCESPPEELEVSPEVTKKANALGYAQMVSEWDRGDFLVKLIDRQIIPYGRVEDIPVDLKEPLLGMFDVFRARVMLVDSQDRASMEVLARYADESGDYVEQPLGAFGDGGASPPTKKNVAVSFTKLFRDRGVARSYCWTQEEFPEHEALRQLKTKYRTTLVRDVIRLCEQYPKAKS